MVTRVVIVTRVVMVTMVVMVTNAVMVKLFHQNLKVISRFSIFKQ